MAGDEGAEVLAPRTSGAEHGGINAALSSPVLQVRAVLPHPVPLLHRLLHTIQRGEDAALGMAPAGS